MGFRWQWVFCVERFYRFGTQRRIRVNERSSDAESELVKSQTLKEEPNAVSPKTLRDDPNREKLRNRKKEPNHALSRQDSEESSRERPITGIVSYVRILPLPFPPQK